MKRTYSVDARIMAINVWRNLGSVRKAGSVANVPSSTLHTWITKIRKGVSLSNRKRKRKEIPTKAIQFIVKTFERKPCTRLQEISQRLNVSVSTISNWKREIGFSWTKTYPYVAHPNLEHQRTVFAKQFDVALNDLISVDETSFCLDMTPLRGHSMRGTRCRVERDKRHRTRKTVVVAVNNKGIVHIWAHPGATNTDRFCAFINALPDNVRGKTLLLDNLAVHRTHQVAECATAKGVKLHFLPPYSPEFQPVEHIFSVAKAHFMNRCQMRQVTPENWDDRILSAFAQIPQAAFHNIFEACRQRIKEQCRYLPDTADYGA